MRRSLLIILFTFLVGAAMAQTRNEIFTDSVTNIVEAINNEDGTIYIYQSSALDALIAPQGQLGQRSSEGASSVKPATCYRIQIFSDNNVRTAKANAEYRKRLIEQQRPDWRTFMTFESPYWRVRVGEFRSQTEADAAMRELKADFPSFADDMKLVRDKISNN